MKISDLTPFRVALAGCFLVVCSNSTWACGLKQGVPYEHFQGVNGEGKLSYWSQLDQIDLGNGLILPININFRSNRNVKSPYLGKGWIFPFLEQKFVQRKENIFAMREPNGYIIPFRRTKTDKTLLRGREGWMAKITGDHTIQAYASCGWSLDYTDGRISDMHTPDNRDISFVYQNGVVTSVQMNDTPLLTVNFDGGTKKVTGVSFNDKAITFDEAGRPLVNRVSGKLVVTKVAKTLHKVTLSNGKTETFDFALDDHMRPTLKISGMDNRSFTWNRRTKKILKDGDWTYKVVLAPKKDRIIRGGKRFANAQIQRTNSAGQTESWFRDYKNGTTTIQNLDGTKVVKQRFLGSGLAGKMRQIVETKNGKSTVVLNRIYGDDHQLLRQTDGSGNTYEWKQEGADRVYTENNVPLIKTTYDASGRPVHETDLRNNVQTSYEYSNQGSQQIVQFPSGVSFLKSYDSHGTLVSNQYLNNANGGGK